MLAPEDVPVLDRLVHEPSRLATKGNLAGHLTKLEDAGLVSIERRFIRKKPTTNVALTPAGRAKIAEHWAQLERRRHLSDPA